MKKSSCSLLIVFILFFTSSLFAQQATDSWTNKSAKKWFNKKEWLNNAHLNPHQSINKKELARQYQINKLYWDKAFIFLATHNLDSLPKGKYIIDADNVTASVTEDPSKNFENTTWESHRKLIDVQCIISGNEKMGVNPVANSVIIKEYDDKKDVANYTADGKFYVAGAGEFFIFFPSDAHRPNITPGGNKLVKKLVIKIKAAQ